MALKNLHGCSEVFETVEEETVVFLKLKNLFQTVAHLR